MPEYKSDFEKRCKQSFAFFLCAVWKHLNLPKPTRRQLEIAQYLQFGPKRLIIEAFRGIGKSWITSAFVCWLLYCNPNLKILVVSASKDRSDAFTTFTLRLIKEMPILKHLTPRADQRESMVAFDVAPAGNAHAPSVKAAGINGQITGSRADVIIGDDVEVPNNSATDDMRVKLINRVGEFNDILVPEGQPRILMLGTPQTEESIYTKLRDRAYECRIWPARYPNAKQIIGYKGALAPSIVKELEANPRLVGKPTDQQRFNDIDLMEREASKGRSSFALQFMLDTSLSDAERYPLKTSDLIVMDLQGEYAPSEIVYGSGAQQMIEGLRPVGFAGDRWYGPMWFDKDRFKKYEAITMAIDPSGRGKDETGYAIVAQLHGKLFLLAAGGLKGGYTDENLKLLAIRAKQWKVRRIVVEANFGDGMWTKLFSPVLHKIYPCSVEEVKHSIQKEKRIIDTLEPVMNQHRLVVNKAMVLEDTKYLDDIGTIDLNQKYSLFYQLTRITNERGALKHDDRLDAVAIAIADFTEMMDRDEDKAAKEHRMAMMKKEIDKHMKAMGIKQPGRGGFLAKRFGR